jgi:uncharacterized membrane protein YdfJ with MMPL/SSD domain
VLQAITRWSCSRRGKWLVVVVWLLAAGLVAPLFPSLSEISENDPLSFLPANAESTRAAKLVRERYAGTGTPAIIVFRNPQGLSDADLQAGQAVFRELQAMQQESDSNVASIISIFNVPEARAELLSADNTTMTMIVTITGSPAEEAYSDRVEAIRDVTKGYDSGTLQVKVTGPGGLLTDLVAVFADIDVFLLLVTAALVLMLLILIYRSPVIAIVPLVIIGLVFQLSSGIAAAILRALDVPVNGQATGIMTVILFGAGTDYYLFIASRYREELARRQDKHEAMAAAINAVGGAILSAGGTLIAASLLLLLADLGSYRSLGPVVALAIAIMLLAALTLMPAVLAILGRNGFWPFRPRFLGAAATEQATSRLWSRLAHAVLSRPAAVLTTTLVALVLLIGGMLLFRPSYDPIESLPSDVESVQGFRALRQGFPAGELAPTNVYVELPSSTPALSPEGIAAIGEMSRALASDAGVASISSPAYPFGIDRGPGPEDVSAALTALSPEQLQALLRSRPGEPIGGSTGQMSDPNLALAAAILPFVSVDQQAARIDVVVQENPYSQAAMDLIERLRQTAQQTAARLSPAPVAVLFGGDTAENADTRAANVRDSLIVLPAILLAIMVILGLLLRSVIAPLYVGLTIVLTYFSTLGLSLLVFRVVFGQESIGNSVPFLLFVFLNALGVDYSIYLMSRLREEAVHLPLRQATERALERTGGVITSAGIILAGTFAALMTLPLRDLFQLGFAVAAGVLIDTFFTRSVLVPTIVELLGKWNWWPNKEQMARAERALSPATQTTITWNDPSP